MAAYFCDTSALVKRYVAETGSAWLTATIAPQAGNYVFVARITFVEVISAIARRERGKHISPNDAKTAQNQFETDYSSEFFNVEISENLINIAANLPRNMLCAVMTQFNSRRLWKLKRKELR